MTFQPCRSVTNDFPESEWDPRGPVLGGSRGGQVAWAGGKGLCGAVQGMHAFGVLPSPEDCCLALGAGGHLGRGTPPFLAPSLPVLSVHPCCGPQHCSSLVAAAQGREVAGGGLAS